VSRVFAASVLVASLAGCHAGPPPAPADPFVATVGRIEPSVVLFTMNVPSDDPKKKHALDEAYGSGVAIASGAWGTQVLTVEHVIHQAQRLRATLAGGKTVSARVVAADEKDDLALVTLRTPNVPVVTLGSSADLKPGMQVGVAGFPIPDAFEDEKLGTKTSVFAGRVSSLRRDAVELDLPIIPGESGGPVFDAHTGVVVALAESRFDEEKSIGFGIPIEDAERFLHGRLRGTRVAGR
jgi:serine protease Do